ncbi:MAG TPA: amidohydrolase family protein [Miltoncostaeaceae bacterium]|nr:amidohydrolase family protein [Miltoncostaeaceae bacterium]
MRLVRAGWVLPVVAAPIHDGAVGVDAGGRITAVGPAAQLIDAHPDAPVADHGPDSLLLPGLVDAHCRLGWSCLGGVGAPRPFADWLRAFLPLRARMAPDDHLAAARAGALRALCAGVTCLADAGPTGAGLAALSESGQRGIVHLEAFGAPADETAARATVAEFAERLAALAEGEGERVRMGVSPHAPYSAGPLLWRALAEHPHTAGRAWMTHIAESPAEEAALAGEGGALAELFTGRGFPLGHWPTPDHASVVARMGAHGALRRGLVAAHCVQVRDDDPQRLRAAGVAMAHCPRSNEYLRCGRAPLADLRARGVTVAIGTDSPASGGDFDPRAEARACRTVFGPSAPPARDLIEMITVDGARAIGLADRIGALAVGHEADLLVLRHPDGGPDDPHERALSAAARVDTVTVSGRVLVAAGEPQVVDAPRIHAAAGAVAARLR